MTTDEIVKLTEVAWRAFEGSTKPAPFNQMRDAIEAVRPLIEAEVVARVFEEMRRCRHMTFAPDQSGPDGCALGDGCVCQAVAAAIREAHK